MCKLKLQDKLQNLLSMLPYEGLRSELQDDIEFQNVIKIVLQQANNTIKNTKGVYEIIEKLNPVAYRLNLAVELEHVYNVLHILHFTFHKDFSFYS